MKQIERGSERQYRDLAELSPDAVIVQVDSRIAFVNQSACRMFRAASTEDLVGVEMSSLVHPEARDFALACHGQVLADGQAVPYVETRHLRLDGTAFPSEMVVGPVVWDGRPGTMNIIHDISLRREAQHALQDTERRLKMVVESAPLLLFALDRDGVFTFSKGKGLELIGYEQDEVVGRNFFEIYRDRPDMRERARRALGGESLTATTRFRGVDLNVAYAPIRDRDGAIAGVVGVSFDISERVKLEEQLRHTQKMEALGKLTGGIAHDFNNILGIVLGNAELLRERLAGSDEIGQELLTSVLRAAERGAELTHRLLAYSRRQPLDPKTVRLDLLVPSMIGMLRRTLGENITVTASFASDLWPCLADPGQVENALINLAINARDAMREGGDLVIETANVLVEEDAAAAGRQVAPGEYVMLAVTDTGTGMSDEVRERVFEPFFTTKPQGEGTGLGLSMVYGFARQSGGDVSIYSELGEGTTVKLYLPRAAEGARTVEARGRPVFTRAHDETVLVVEDDADVRALSATLLGSLGYRVREAEDSASALSLIAAEPGIDLLFTDVILKGDMNGLALAERARELRPGIKVLFMSGYTQNAITRQGRIVPHARLLQKPFRKAELARKVREALAAGVQP